MVNISGANYLGAGQGDLAAATAAHNVAKAAYDSALSVKNAALVEATALSILEDAIEYLTVDGTDVGETVFNAFQSASSIGDLVSMGIAATTFAQSNAPTTQEEIATLRATTPAATAGYNKTQQNKVLDMIALSLDGVPLADVDARTEVVENSIDAALMIALKGQYGDQLYGIGAAVTAIANTDNLIQVFPALAKMTPATAAAVDEAYVGDEQLAYEDAASLATGVSASGYSFANLQAAAALINQYTSTPSTSTDLANNNAYAATIGALLPIISQAVSDIYPAYAFRTGESDDLDTSDVDESFAGNFAPESVTFDDIKAAINDYITFTDVEDTGQEADITVALSALATDVAAASTVASKAKAAALATGNALELAEAAVSSATVSASGFAGAEQVWLKGASGDVAVSAGADQIIGFSGVTAMANTVTTAAVSPTFAISGSKGELEVKSSKATSVNFIGTGGEVAVSLTRGSTATNELAAVTSSASGTLTLDLTALADLETVTANGEGGLVIEGVSDTVATVTTGEGADKLTLNTETKKDLASTSKDETVTATLESGDGADQVVVTVSGAGIASVDTGAGNDVIKVDHSSTGDVDITAGAGNDVVWLEGGTAELTAKASVDGGEGIDTLAIPGDDVFSTGDYLKLNQYATSFESILAVGAIGSEAKPVDASEFADVVAYTVTAGENFFEEVASGTAFTNTVYQRDEEDYLGEWSLYNPETNPTGKFTFGSSNVSIEAAGYKADEDYEDDDFSAEYGGDVSITSATISSLYGQTNAYTVNASNVQLVVAAVDLGKNGGAAQNVTLSGDMETATVVLASARGSSTKAGAEYLANFSIITDPTDTAADAMQGLTTITVIGAGTVEIDARDDGETSLDAAAENLTVINLAGMTDFANLDKNGDADTYSNLSTTQVLTSDQISQTVKLGGALDTVTTSSSSDYMDMIEGFALEANLDTDDDDTDIDDSASDVLVLNVSGDGVSEAVFVADDTEYTSIEAALIAVAAGDDNNVVFHAEGNTYAFAGNGDGELDSGDVVVGLVGTYDLDQLINAVSAVDVTPA